MHLHALIARYRTLDFADSCGGFGRPDRSLSQINERPRLRVADYFINDKNN